MGSASLEEIVRRAQKGDEAAFSDLIERFQMDLFRFCVYLTRTPHEAEDLTQEVFLKVLGGIQKLRDPAQFKSWLFRTAKNLFLDQIRAKNVRRAAPEEQLVQAQGDRLPSDPDLVLELQRVLEQLTPEDRLLVLLVDQQGYSYAEAGTLLELSEAAVTSRIYRIRREIREKMDVVGKETGRRDVL